MTTWTKSISLEMAKHGDTWGDIVKSTLSQSELNAEFDDSFGFPQGKPFTLWTHDRVYFPIQYDGAEWAASVPRNPTSEATNHHGG